MPISLCASCRGSGQPSTARQRVNSALAAALRQLPVLRQLDLSASSFDDTGLSAASSLAHLQDLRIESLGRTTAASYTALPTTLTRLEMRHMKELVITSSDAAGLEALSQLWHLQLQDIGGVEVSALGSMMQLTYLQLQGLEKSASSQSMQQLLAALDVMQQLQHLDVSAKFAGCDAATNWAALVASTQLTLLCYEGPVWHYGEYNECAESAAEKHFLEESVQLCSSIWCAMRALSGIKVSAASAALPTTSERSFSAPDCALAWM
jgi:hypothetical protein